MTHQNTPELGNTETASRAARTNPEALYLDLLKKTLTFSLWPEPPLPITMFNYQNPPLKRYFIKQVSKLLRRAFRLHLVKKISVNEEDRLNGKVWPIYAETMVGIKRLDNLQYCIEQTLQNGVEGDLIETGVWRGGSCIFMRAVLKAYGVTDRKVIVADSFQGLPKPDAERYPRDKGDEFYTHASYLGVSRAQVQGNFEKYGLLDNQVEFLEGWFEDTLPTAPVEKLSILRLDGDMYGSTMVALKSLYPKLSRGGFCIVDDYALPGCKAAVDDYRRDQGIATPIKNIDWTGNFWIKD